MNKVKVGIIGGAGYTGGEAIRLLLNHPAVELVFAHSRSNAGKPVSSVHGDLAGETSLKFSNTIEKCDVLFLCLGHGESSVFMKENDIDASVKVIDLSQDFRLNGKAGNREFVYGLPELQRDAIKKASNIANPGCFATALELGLLPLASKGLLGDVFTTGITGSTGAGQKLQQTTHFTWRANNISPYKTLTHQHLKEVNQTLKKADPGYKGNISFLPWRGDYPRGIFVSSCVTADMTREDAIALYKDFYKDHPFTIVMDEGIDLKRVVNTNKCLVYLEKEGDKLVVHTAIDNLLKGASGQAVQNMNLICGLEETAGLRLKAIVF